MTEKITEHVQSALELLLEQYKGKPNIAALLTAFASQVQELEDSSFDVRDKRFPVVAEGAILDKFGSDILACDREGSGDEDYRSRIFARMGQYISDGSPEALISIYKILMQASYVEYKEESPAKVQMIAVGARPVSNVQAIKDSLYRAKPAGVEVSFLATVALGVPFVFDGDPDPTGQGFGDLDNPAVGGVLAEIL